jgi:hypothetical protein
MMDTVVFEGEKLAEKYKRKESSIKKMRVGILHKHGKFLAAIMIVAIAVVGISAYFLLRAPAEEGGLQIVFKDQEMFTIFVSRPTVKEVWLQRSDGTWNQIWTGERTLELIPEKFGGSEQVLVTVDVDAGTYVGVKAYIGEAQIEADFNGDGDTDDMNVETAWEGHGTINETFTIVYDDYYTVEFVQSFVYDGSGGKLVFDITFRPDLPEEEEITVTVTHET